MEGFLQGTAAGRSKGVAKWYAMAHAARCGRCNRYLSRLKETVDRLQKTKTSESNPEALKRLAAGAWRDHAPKG